MSLKAKIEAVIYASEEPVTLAQLTGLLGEEGQAELQAIAAQQHFLALEDEEANAEANESGVDAASAPEPIEDADALNAETTEAAPEPEPAAEVGAPGLASETWEAEPTNPNGPPAEAPAPESDAKQLARAAAAETKARDAEQKLAARKLRDYFRSLLDELIADYAYGDRGLEIREVAGGFRLGTKAEYHDAVRGFVKSLKPPLKLSLQALETLAVVAYKQPVTAPEVSEIRGVDSAGVLGSLLARKLVTTAGRKQVIGRPILYKTTKDFLLRFGLKDINELPSIEEFEKMAGELNDAVQEEIPMETETASTEASNADPIELEGHNLQPVEPDAPTTEPESIPEAETPSELEPSANLHSSQPDGEPEDETSEPTDETAPDHEA
jgi:segregation and condensation protein B